MCSQPPNLSNDDSVQSDIKTATDRLLDAVEIMTTSGQDKDATTSHWEEKDSRQHSNSQQLDDNEGKEITKQPSDPGVNIVDDADTDFEYSLIEDKDGDPISSGSSDETIMDDAVGLLYPSSGYNSGFSDEDLFASLEDARNLDDDDFLPSDPSAEDVVADAEEAARFAAEIEFLRWMALFMIEEPEEQGAGDSGIDPEEPRDLMDID